MPDSLVCAICRCADLDPRRTRPTPQREAPEAELSQPWTAIERFPEGAVLTLHGGPGSGKSSLAAHLGPGTWLTSEQTPEEAGRLLRRSWPGEYKAPQVHVVETQNDLIASLGEAADALVVIDSITQMGGLQAQADALIFFRTWCKAAPGRRGIAILQHNKAGEAAGLRELEHLVDVICPVYQEGSGLRVLGVTKNRNGPLGSHYFTLDGDGVGVPAFRGLYSVEGNIGAYRLHPWPLKGATFGGWIDKLAASDTGPPLQGGSAALHAPGLPGDIWEPADVEQRKSFAVAHGLPWLNPETTDAWEGTE